MTKKGFNLSQTDTEITLDGITALKTEVNIDLVEYSDNTYDIHFVYSNTDDLFGLSTMSGVHGYDKAITIVWDLVQKTGLEWKLKKDTRTLIDMRWV
jgi:hypothetical protein